MFLLPSKATKGQNYTFYAVDSFACENDIIGFNIVPTPPTGSSITWDFGIKKIINNPNPKIAYLQVDTYSVVLKITPPNKPTQLITKNNYIHIGKIPNVQSVSVSKKIACDLSDEVTFTTNSTDGSKWLWTIGDQFFSQGTKSISTTFNKIGYPQVQLVVVNKFGCTNKKVYDSLIHVLKKPSLSINLKDSNLCTGSVLVLNPKFNLYNHSTIKYDWKFPGATPSISNKAIPDTLVFNTIGNFKPSLLLSNLDFLCSYEIPLNTEISVSNSNPLSLHVIGLNGPKPCSSTAFNIQLQGNSINAQKAQWFFDKTDSLLVSDIDSLTKSVSYKYDDNYQVSVVYNGDNCTQLISQKIMAKDNGLKAIIEDTKECICTLPTKYQLTNKSTFDINIKVNFHWHLVNDLKDTVEQSNDSNFIINLSNFEKYTAYLKVQDSNNCFSSTSYLFEPKALKASFSASNTTACLGSPINFTMQELTCNDSVVSAYLILYDRNNTNILDTVYFDNPEYTYQDTGLYDIQMYIETLKGCKDSILEEELIHIADFKDFTTTSDTDIYCIDDTIKFKLSYKPISFEAKVSGYIINSDKSFSDTFDIYPDKNSIAIIAKQIGVYDVHLLAENNNCKKDIVLKNHLKIGGIQADFSLDNTSGCIPFSTNLRAHIIKNQLYGNSDTSIQYLWSTDPAKKIKLSNPTQKNTQLQANVPVTISTKLELQNAMGCSTVIQKDSIIQLKLKAQFSVPKNYCSNSELKLINESEGAIASYKWTSNDTSAVFSPSDTAESPILLFDNSGYYTISLTVIDSNNCSQTYTDSIQVFDFGLDFSVIDNEVKCSPADFTFTVNSTNVDTLIWNFGDGTSFKTDQLNFLKIYDLTRVVPYSNTFTVSLTGTNKYGCSTTKTKPNLIEVRGPLPRFKAINNVGCSPHKVEFSNNSINCDKIYFDYGDNSSIDSVNLSSHLYKNDSKENEYSVYKPFVIVHDKYDCKLRFLLEDSIVIYNQSQPKFGLSDTAGCADFNVSFFDSSKFASKWKWDFNMDGITDNTQANPKNSFPVGKYDISLTTTNKIGCDTSITVKGIVESYPNPTANFTPNDTITCVLQPLQFKDKSISRNKLVQWQWDFGDLYIDTDTSSLRNPTYLYMREDTFSSKLVVTDINGCKDSIIKPNNVQVFGKLPIDSPQISELTIIEDKELYLAHNSMPEYAFRAYELGYNADTLNPFTISNLRTDTTETISKLAIYDSSYCIRTMFIDKCYKRHISPLHCTIVLKNDTSEKYASKLFWNAYVGWPVSNYLVYRKTSKSNFQLIGEISGDSLSYLDTNICEKYYTYKIEAVNKNTKQYSTSNYISFKPKYIRQTEPLHLNLVSIDSNKQVLISWQRSKQKNVQSYLLDKKSLLDDWSYESIKVTDTFYYDKQTQITKEWYRYKVSVLDECNYKSQKSDASNSILLNAQILERDILLTWNKYRKWTNGVKSYILEVKEESSNTFETIAQFDSNTTSFVDTSSFLKYNNGFDYRLRAIENSEDTALQSLSNIAHIKPIPTLFVPNAFSPNGDGINDVFALNGLILGKDPNGKLNFNLSIYNRWGQLIFTSDSMTNGWDGTFEGTKCPEGVYYWVATAYSLDKKLIAKNGTITLMR